MSASARTPRTAPSSLFYGWAFSAGGGIAIAAGMMATMIRRPGARRTMAIL